MVRELTDQQRKAVGYLIRGYSKMDAMIKAGYAPTTARSFCSVFFKKPQVAAELKQRRKRLRHKTGVDAQWIMERLMAIAEQDVAKLLSDDGSPVPLNQLDPALRKALDITIVGDRVKISTSDRLRALDQLAKVAGLYEEKIRLEGEIDLKDRLMAGRQRAAMRKHGEEERDE